MYYEIAVENYEKSDYEELSRQLNNTTGIEAIIKEKSGKNMFAGATLAAILTINVTASDIATNVIAGLIVAAIGKGTNIAINAIKTKIISVKEMTDVLDEINNDL